MRCWSWNVVLSRAFDLFFLLFFLFVKRRLCPTETRKAEHVSAVSSMISRSAFRNAGLELDRRLLREGLIDFVVETYVCTFAVAALAFTENPCVVILCNVCYKVIAR